MASAASGRAGSVKAMKPVSTRLAFVLACVHRHAVHHTIGHREHAQPLGAKPLVEGDARLAVALGHRLDAALRVNGRHERQQLFRCAFVLTSQRPSGPSTTIERRRRSKSKGISSTFV